MQRAPTTLLVLALLVVALLQISNAFTSDSLKIKLDHGGVLVGRHHVTVKGRHMRAFMGIPYAKPPVGELRFKVSENKTLFHTSGKFLNKRLRI